ncbi:MAG: hypothetical protein ACO1SV_05690 [Fimbriimonas sp.]
MKHLTLFVAAALALVVAGCGGGGGNDGGNNPPDETLSQPRIEAVVRIERTNLRDPNKYTNDELLDPQTVNPDDLIVPTVYGVQDMRNFQTNESYYFQLVAYSDSGRRVILPARFETDDVEFLHGVVGNSGLYLASNVPTQEPIAVSAVDDMGSRYSAEYEVKERQIRVVGSVVSETTQAPVPNVTVEFYDENGLLVSSVKTAYDGSFRASTPISTVSMSVNSQLLSNDFYRSYVTGGFRYNAGDVDCRTPISFDAAGTVVIETIALTPRVAGQGTPAADGCNGEVGG